MPDVEVPTPFEAYVGDDPYLFAAYAHADAPKVYPVLQFLHDAGFRVWYDEGIDPGNEWPDDVARRLGSCSAFVVFISGSAITSRNVRNEINFALTRDKPIVAIHIEATPLPPGLELQIGSVQAILLYRMSLDSFGRSLTRALDPSLRDAGTQGSRLPQFRAILGEAALTKQGLKSLCAAAQSGDAHALSEMRKAFGLDSSPVAAKATSRFIGWLEKYNHGTDGYATVGDALASWLTADSGTEQVGEDWGIFLRMVGYVIASPELQRGISVPVYDGPPTRLGLPTSDDWLAFIDGGRFQVAVAENRARRLEYLESRRRRGQE